MKTNQVIVEIRAAEGGKDSKILVDYQLDIYSKACTKYCL